MLQRKKSPMPGFKAAKNRLALTFRDNVAEYYRLKLMLVHRAENPRAIKGLVKATLLIIKKIDKSLPCCIIETTLVFASL